VFDVCFMESSIMISQGISCCTKFVTYMASVAGGLDML
jgi:hypothetical protein